MDSSHSLSPHCIPSPPLFSLDVRNLAHLCFEELPTVATTEYREPQQQRNLMSRGHEKHSNAIAEKEFVTVTEDGVEPTIFLPIEQHSAESKDVEGSTECRISAISTGHEEDIFDEIFTTLEDFIEGDDCRKDTANLLYEGSDVQYDSLLDPSSHPKTKGSDPLALTVDSGSGHTTMDNSRSNSPLAIRNQLSYGYESSSSSNGSSSGSISEPGSETIESCVESLHEHHNSGGLEGIIDKFGKLKPRQHGVGTTASASAGPNGWVDSREQLLARAMAMAQESNFQQQQQQLKASSNSSDFGGGVEQAQSGSNRIGLNAVSTNRGQSGPQPIAPFLLSDAPPSSHVPPPPIASSIQQSQQPQHPPAPPPPSVASSLLESQRNHNFSTATSASGCVADIPIEARALPILPTSLESFRSQLSKSKKESQSLLKKKQRPPANKKGSKHSTGGEKDISSLPMGGIAVNSKKSAVGGKRMGINAKSKETSKADGVHGNNYDLSQYFSTDEISGLLLAICSDDENEVDDPPSGGHEGRLGAAVSSSMMTYRPPSQGHSHGHSTEFLQDHVVFTPHVDSTGAVFSFGNSTNSGHLNQSYSAHDRRNINSRNVSSVNSSLTTSDANGRHVPRAQEPKKRKAGGGASPARVKRVSSESPSKQIPSQSRSAQGIEDVTRTTVANMQNNFHGHGRREPCSMSLETQRKIAEDSEKVLKMQTDKILHDSQQRQLNGAQSGNVLSVGGSGVGAGGPLPSLLSSLSSVGGSLGQLQGLAGLSSVLQGANTGIPSLSSMYAHSASNYHQSNSSSHLSLSLPSAAPMLPQTSPPAVPSQQGTLLTSLLPPYTHTPSTSSPSLVPGGQQTQQVQQPPQR